MALATPNSPKVLQITVLERVGAPGAAVGEWWAMAHFEPTDETAVALIGRQIEGPISMLNLLRFRDVADYRESPELAPPTPISGAEAYRLYAEWTLPFLHASGGEIVFEGDGGAFSSKTSVAETCDEGLSISSRIPSLSSSISTASLTPSPSVSVATLTTKEAVDSDDAGTPLSSTIVDGGFEATPAV